MLPPSHVRNTERDAKSARHDGNACDPVDAVVIRHDGHLHDLKLLRLGQPSHHSVRVDGLLQHERRRLPQLLQQGDIASVDCRVVKDVCHVLFLLGQSGGIGAVRPQALGLPLRLPRDAHLKCSNGSIAEFLIGTVFRQRYLVIQNNPSLSFTTQRGPVGNHRERAVA